MSLQDPGTKQGDIESKVRCKLANEGTRYHAKVTRGGYQNSRVHFTANCQKTVLNWDYALRESMDQI